MLQLIHSWENPTSSTRNTIVFANRNQLYGAYILRQRYEKTLAKSFLFTLSVCALLLVIPIIKNTFSERNTSNSVVEKETPYEFMNAQTIKPEVLPELPKPPAGLAASTFVFKVPQVTDEIINDNPPVQDAHDNETPGFINHTSDSGTVTEIVPTDTATSVVTVFNPTDVQEMPLFPGGVSGMMNYLISNIHYPHLAREANIHGTVYISFVIDKEGNLNDANVLRGIGGGCDEEALRVVKKMPLWTAGKQNGRSVMVRMILPVQFSLR